MQIKIALLTTYSANWLMATTSCLVLSTVQLTGKTDGHQSSTNCVSYKKKLSAITFLATEHYCPFASTKLYCLVTDARVCVNNLPRVLTRKCNSRAKPATY